MSEANPTLEELVVDYVDDITHIEAEVRPLLHPWDASRLAAASTIWYKGNTDNEFDPSETDKMVEVLRRAFSELGLYLKQATVVTYYTQTDDYRVLKPMARFEGYVLSPH